MTGRGSLPVKLLLGSLNTVFPMVHGAGGWGCA